MRRIFTLFLFIMACKVSVFASHIVGGEFELLHLQDFQYRLNMLLYFDEINGAEGAKDPMVTAYIWRKSDNTLMARVDLSMLEDVLVPYSNSDCDDGQLITAKLTYSNTITLPAADYSDPEGYYISWERCCRNYNIDNIKSDDPQNGIAAGQTFYLEFPPVTVNGERFINSTPRLFPPLRDYGCIDKFYFVDFGGVDDDGDSLVYSLVTPYSTIEPTALPANPNPGPYPDVIWEDLYSIDNIMDGDPDLAISTSGLLTVTPTNIGLYVFAVKCEEYRDGEKIGEMRRDFQMLVVSNCANEDPVVRAREEGQSDFYTEGDVLTFSEDDDEEDRCIEILVTDQPVSGKLEESVEIRMIPINFDSELEDIEIDFSENVKIRSEADTARFTVCFPECPFSRNGFYQVGIIAYDDACPQPALDTVIVSLNVPPPPNDFAYFADNRGGSRKSIITQTVVDQVGGSITVPINAFDDDFHTLTLDVEPLGFNFEDVGMTLAPINFADGEARTELQWNFDCNADDLNFSSARDVSEGDLVRKAFDIIFTAEDADKCEWEDPQQLLLTLIIEFPDQTIPNVYRQGQPERESIKLNYIVGEELVVPIKADDADKDQITLKGFSSGFEFNDFGVSFADTQGAGVPGIRSDLNINLACNFDISSRDSLHMLFITEDIDACQLTNADTLDLKVNLLTPSNDSPRLRFNSLNQVKNEKDTLSILIGESINARLSGFDIDNDSITLTLFNVEPEVEGFEFDSIAAVGQLSEDFSWTPDCSVFRDDTYTENYTFSFMLSDNNCFSPKQDTLAFTVHIEDIDPMDDLGTIPNFFSPNKSDDVNAFFGPYRYDENGELINILPVDNCAGQYQGALIYNRWGRVVYQTAERDFKWDGANEPTGVYYYLVKFSNREFKGWVQMMK
ncbi:hypothetical protein E1176_10615 [Fulvivirga sp. RKSG066]|uniref:T9SS type B sorting domain-containing protein n=1 Tax=Fulvivirga aurantia TaxID=2529383 RepID=UPI0012BB5F26|nr:gliding motility-associated C-terminal domain-containing protein [Fulvivirga aurantia]MTI21470.1 hypothetical protein [Fulvivirga aurantia]